ncbi:MAG: PIN domain-containing protein [Chloroflexia bacterium]|nr:PIN domain-containing protein [Chloroflexia bacterium]
MKLLPPHRRIFVDTSAYFAAAYRRDATHLAALRTMERLVLDRHPLITTTAVLFELHGLLLARGPRELALETVSRIGQSPATTVVRLRRRDEEQGWNIVRHYDDKDFSLTDATSFAVMERLGIGLAFTLDRHFIQFGWETVPLDAERPS